MFSPDGKRIAFTSDRSGTFQVWICEGDGSNARQLTFLEGQQTGLGTWSPDGSRIAFNSQANGNYDIYVVGINGEPPRQLTTDTTDEVSPTWSNDGQWVYFASPRTGRHEIYKMPVEGGTAVQVTRSGGQRPLESADGKFVYYEKGMASSREFEPWRVSVNGGDESPVVEGHISRWALVNGGLYFYQLRQDGQSAGTWWLMFYEFATAGKHAVAPLEGMPLLGHRPAVSPDRQTILYAQLDLNDTDLVLVENFR
jgi:Tol biopolymer transport system component